MTSNRGKNQYSAPSPRPVPPTRPADVYAAAAHPDEFDVEEIAWRFHPDHQNWYRNGFVTAAAAGPWHDRGFTAEQAATWTVFAFDPESADRWRSCGFNDPDRADTWRQEGFDPIAAGRWRSFGFTAYAATVATQNGFCDPTDAYRWNITLRPVLNDVGITNVTMIWEFAARYRDNDVTPDQAADMIRDGASSNRRRQP